MRRLRRARWRGGCAGLLLTLPLFGAQQTAEDAIRAGNAAAAAGQLGAALEHYDTAARYLPDAPELAFNRANIRFREHDYERALEGYLATLGSDDPELVGRAQYNIGVIKLRQAMAIEHSASDALALAQAAIRAFRASLAQDAGRADARYNLELAYRFAARVRQAQDQQTAAGAPERTTFKRGQELSDRIRNEGGGQRRALADANRRAHGERGNEVPENFANNAQQRQPKDARLPMAMNPAAAGELMDQLLAAIQAGEAWLQDKRRSQQLQAPGEGRPW
jgi:tetratricopeptide (TPR) repeat protein